MWLSILLLYYSNSLINACLPTQNVQVTTTTTTTTTPAPSSAPCTVCPPIYGAGCLSGIAPDLCASIAEVGIKYTLGLLPGYNYGDANTCSTIFSCPVGYTSKVKELITGWVVDGPSLVIATCEQTGANAGIWYYGIPPLTTPVEIVASTCEPIISGR